MQDITKRNELFEYFKTNIIGAKYKLDSYSKLRAGKKPLIAMCVVIGLFLWTYSIAQGIEEETDYRIIGSIRSIASIVMMIATLGKKKVIMIFGALLGIALTSFIMKTRNPKVVHTILI